MIYYDLVLQPFFTQTIRFHCHSVLAIATQFSQLAQLAPQRQN